MWGRVGVSGAGGPSRSEACSRADKNVYPTGSRRKEAFQMREGPHRGAPPEYRARGKVLEVGEDYGGFGGAVVAFDGDVVDAGEEVGLQDVGGGAGGDEAAFVEEEEVVGEGGGEVE